jgi:sugar/nucleoside kinase (ribokinase family)
LAVFVVTLQLVACINGYCCTDSFTLTVDTTQAAVKLAQLARSQNIPIVLDCEKDRPHFRDLLPLADYLVCNSGFAQSYMQCDNRLEGMAALLRLGSAKLVVSTLGAEGSVLMYKDPPWPAFADTAAYSSVSSSSDRSSVSSSVTAGDSIPLTFKHSKYSSSSSSSSSSTATAYSVVHCSAWPTERAEIVDTTGAYYFV